MFKIWAPVTDNKVRRHLKDILILCGKGFRFRVFFMPSDVQVPLMPLNIMSHYRTFKGMAPRRLIVSGLFFLDSCGWGSLPYSDTFKV